MEYFTIIILISIFAMVAYNVFGKKTSNSKDQQIDELKTESFINTAAEAAAKASAKATKEVSDSYSTKKI